MSITNHEMRSGAGLLLCSLALALAGIAPALAADIDWTGAAGDGLWSNTNNWQGGVVPGTNDHAFFSNVASNWAHQVIVDDEHSIYRMTVSGGDNRSFNFSATNNGTLTFGDYVVPVWVTATVADDIEFAVPIYTTHTSTTYLRNLGDHWVTYSDLVHTGGRTIYHSSGKQAYLGSVTAVGINITPGSQLYWGAGTHTLTGSLLVPSTGTSPTLLLATNMTFSHALEVRNDTTFYIGVADSGSEDRILSHGRQIRGRSHDNSLLSFLENDEHSTGRMILRTSGSGDTYGIHTLPIDTRDNTYIQFNHTGAAQMTYELNTNSNRAMRIGGEGHLWKSNSGTLIVRTDRNTYSGRTIISGGTLRLDSFDILEIVGEEENLQTNVAATIHGQLPSATVVEIGTSATFDLNGIDQTVGGVTGFRGLDQTDQESFGTLALGGGTLTIHSETDTSFAGAITGTGSLVKTGSATFTLAAGHTNVADRTLRVAGGVLAVTGALSVEDGTFELSGGRITADSLAAKEVEWNITLLAAYEGQVLVDVTGNADITDATLALTLADGYAPAYGKEFTLLYAGTLTGAAEGGTLFQYDDGETFFDGGQEYRIAWSDGSGQIILTAIPEPGSLVLLWLAATGFWLRRRMKG